MRKIYDSGAMELLPAGSGFVFSARQSANEEKIVVSYKMYSLTVGTLAPVTRSVFLHTKFGDGYKKFEKSKRDFLSCRAVALPDGNLLVAFQNGAAAIFCGDEPVWQGDIQYKGGGPADVAFAEGALWFCFPGAGAVVKYSLRHMREELRIGGGREAAFTRPQSIWCDGGTMMLCNTGARKVCEIDLKTFMVSDYAAFEEPVRQYLKIGAAEVVLLESGIYRL